MSNQIDSRTGKPKINNPLKGWEKEKQRRQLSKAKVKANRDSRPRRRDWEDADDYPQVERIMPRGEMERRQQTQAVVQAASVGSTGVVIEVSSGLCRVAIEDRVLICTVRGSLTAQETGYTNVIAVGDEVQITEKGEQGVVEAILPRRTVLARPDGHLQQIIVANVDQLLIVGAWRNPPLWLELIDRYRITAARNDIQPILCINKIDLAEDRTACEELLTPYQQDGLTMLFTSAETGEGIAELRTLLKDRTTVLAGMSGVGKSSLLSQVQPGLNLKVSAISDYFKEGRHTTTQVSRWPMEQGGVVIDTPGIREFGLAGLEAAELASYYPEIDAYASQCRFADCSHQEEPDCAVRAAVQRGAIAAWRHKNYVALYQVLA